MFSLAHRRPHRRRRPAMAALTCFSMVAAGACDLPSGPPRFQPTFVVGVEEIRVPVTSANASGGTERDLGGIDDELADRSRGGAIVVDIDNATGAIGVVSVRLAGGGAVVTGTVDVAGGDGQRIEIAEEQLRALLGSTVDVTVTGRLCPADGCAQRPPPFPEVTFKPRIEVVVEI